MKIFKKLFELNSVFWFNKWQPKSALREEKHCCHEKPTHERQLLKQFKDGPTKEMEGRRILPMICSVDFTSTTKV